MDNNDLLELMRINGLRKIKIRRVVNHPIETGVALESMLLALVTRFVKVVRMHAAMNIIILSMFLLNYKSSGFYELLILIFLYVTGVIVCERFAPIPLPFKSFKIRKYSSIKECCHE